MLDLVVAGVAGVVFALAGAWVQRRWSLQDRAVELVVAEKAEHRRWMRDHRLEAYTEVVDAVSALVRSSLEVMDSAKDAHEHFTDAMERIHHAASLVNIVGSADMRDRVTEFMSVVPSLIAAFDADDNDALDSAIERLADAGAFSVAAGSELDQRTLAPRFRRKPPDASDPGA